jgi:hypothetical protein
MPSKQGATVDEWRTQLASDVDRDGLGLELLDSSGAVCAEVFRCDRDHTVLVTTFVPLLPSEALAWLCTQAAARLDPFEDGSALPAQRTWKQGAA